jgi:hypothetical protein
MDFVRRRLRRAFRFKPAHHLQPGRCPLMRRIALSLLSGRVPRPRAGDAESHRGGLDRSVVAGCHAGDRERVTKGFRIDREGTRRHRIATVQP